MAVRCACRRAEPLEAPVVTRLTAALAGLLLSGRSSLAVGARPGVAEVLLFEEVRALALDGDPAALAAYRKAAGPALLRNLHNDPRYPAACFVAWSSFPGTSPGWEETGRELLEQVLRPAVRDLPPEARDRVGSLVANTPFRAPGDRPWFELWTDWQRGRAPGGLVGRLFGRGRTGPARRTADELAPPRDSGGAR